MNYDKILNDTFKAVKESKRVLIPFFEGHKGVGKTDLVKNYCKQNNLELVILNLACIESGDFTGIPYIENGLTKYGKPEFLNIKKRVLFLDEMNRVTQNDVKSALLSLLVDRKINGHELSSEVIIVGAGNPNESAYEVTEFDEALSDRIKIIPFNRSYKDFLDYLESCHERSNLLDFYKLHSDSLKSYSFRRLEMTLNYYEVSNDIESLSYSLSANVYTLFVEYLNNNLFNFNDLLKGEVKSSKKELDSSAEKKLLLDINEALKNDYQFTNDEAKNVNHFLNSVRAENKQLFFRDLQNLAIKDKNFDTKKVQWKKLELFKGLKEYLDNFLS